MDADAANEALVAANRRLEQAIARANDMALQADRANRTKSEFLANVSHEIRTPMSTITGFAELLAESGLNDAQSEYVSAIAKSGEHLILLLNDILDFSKIEAGELELEAVAFDPEAIVYEACDNLGVRLGHKPLDLACRFDGRLPAALIGDPHRFRQVVTNLVENAFKFTPGGEIEVALAVADETESRLQLHLTVRDTGIGIPAGKLEEIFNPFQQADGSTTRRYGGTGLGLSICTQIAQRLDGKVWAVSPVAESPPEAADPDRTGDPTDENGRGPGSLFHFTAWLKKKPEERPRRFRSAALSGKRLLFVGAGDATRAALQHLLAAAGMEVVCAADAAEALDLLRSPPPDAGRVACGLIDFHCPAEGVAELVRAIRTSPPRVRDLPLIALLAHADRRARRLESEDLDGCVGKPVRRGELVQMVTDAVTRGRRRDVASAPRAAEAGRKPAPAAAATILVVEDNEVNQTLTQIMLTKAGYRVELAANGREALERFGRDDAAFDLILMDVQMPEMDGFEAVKAIRAQESRRADRPPDKGAPDDHPRRGPRVPIVAMTAHAVAGYRDTCLEAGMDDYIVKPVGKERLLEVLRKLI
jgi:signal transduction histidine kinase/CheY-like chemotaxis protein